MSKDTDAVKQSIWNFDNLAYQLIVITVFLIPFFFLPFIALPADLLKRFIFVVIATVVAGCWLVTRFSHGELRLPRSITLAVGGLLVLVSLVSALFSGAINHSLVGFVFDQDSTIYLLLLMVLMTLIGALFQQKNRLITLMAAFFAAALIVFLYQALKWLGLPIVSLILDNPPAFFRNSAVNLIGKWNSFGVFGGLITLLAAVSLEYLPLREIRWIRITLWTLGIAGLIAAIMVNFNLVWVTLALTSVLVLGYGWIKAKTEEGVFNFFRPSLYLLVIAMVFTFAGQPDGFLGSAVKALNGKMGINVLEVRPSFSGTMTIAKASLKESPLLGTGPNKFTVAWLKHKPLEVNASDFWDLNFDVGYGNIISAAVTLGGAGAILWLAFLVSIIWIGRKVFQPGTDQATNAILILTFIGAIYSWIFTLVYATDTVLYIVPFVFTGMFIAALAESGKMSEFVVPLTTKWKFVPSVGLIVVLVIGLGGLYLFTQRLWSFTTFAKAQAAAQTGDVNRAESLLIKAGSRSGSEVYDRALVDIQLIKMGELLRRQGEQEKVLAEFQGVLSRAVNSAQRAVTSNKHNYLNWLYLGRVYEFVVPLGIQDSYAHALKSYQEAQALNPRNPGIYLDMARLELANDNESRALELVDQALKVKSNYTQAIFLLAQLEAEKGNLGAAIAQAEKATEVAPNDAGAWFQLGFLRYRNGNYSSAAQALERSVAINQVYANAKYFLGLSYDQLGRKADALAVFEQISATNQDHQELKQIISNLRAGRPALANTTKPEPDEREKPPIDED